MKLRFSDFHKKKLNESFDFSIKHIEDLDVGAFVKAVENIQKLRAVQKLDGANLRMGLDDKGEFYTSREQKGGKRFYHQKDFPKHSSHDGFRAAHDALRRVKPEIEQILAPGEAVSLEVIFGKQPNTVIYGKDGMNYVAFLEMIPGDDPTIDPDQSKIKKLNELLKDRVVAAKTNFWETSDGVNMVQMPRLTDWKFTTSDRIPKSELETLNFESELADLKNFLEETNETAKKQGKDLSNFEVMKDKSRDLADEREALETKLMDEYKVPIKKKLLDLVYKQKPSLRSEMGDEGAYDGIEGIIFSDPSSGERFKVVDRDIFTRINQFNYQVRKTVAGRIMSADSSQPIEQRGGIVGEARLRSLKMFGLESAELPNQQKRVLEKFKGDSREETVKNIADSLHQLNFDSLDRKLQAIYISALDDLDESLESFRKNGDEYTMTLENGKTIKYTDEINRRTLMTFAEARKDLVSMLVKIKKCEEMEDLIELFFGNALDALHGSAA